MRKQGFTLIELLVVIAIIALLAAILFPVFAGAREKARQSSCLSNMRQMMLATLMYADDYTETLPLVQHTGGRWVHDLLQTLRGRGCSIAARRTPASTSSSRCLATRQSSCVERHMARTFGCRPSSADTAH